MVDFRLYAISDRSLVADPLSFVAEATRAGLKALQLREKDMSARDIVALTKRIKAGCVTLQLFISDRADIALAAGANGVHLPEQSWPASRAKHNFPTLLCGASVHSREAAKHAENEGADFIVFGPIFETPSKQALGIKAKGIDALKELVEAVRIPIFAVGGITPERAMQCRQVGAHGVSVIRDLWTAAADIDERLRQYKEALGSL